MRISRRWKLLSFVALVIVVAYAFLAGPLFAWSPVKPGYDVLRLQRADVYFPTGRELDPAYRNLEGDIEATERFHQMKLPRRMSIIVCRNWSDFHRFMPTMPGEGLGAATPEFGNVTYITPKIDEMNFDPREFIRHELSHAILLQNAGLWKALRFKQHPWLLEGLAVLAADQHAYGGRSELINLARGKSLVPLFQPQPYTKPGFDMRSAYVSWRYFLEWTISESGRAPFQQLITAFIDDPSSVESVFKRIYGEELETAVRRFEASLQGT